MSRPASSPSTLALVAGLSTARGRDAAVAALAEKIGAQSALLFVRDPSLGLLMPAPGMPQTVRGGPNWRKFIADCPKEGRCSGTVELPKGTEREVLGLLSGGSALILVGGQPDQSLVAEFENLLPLVAALLAAEQDATLARAQAAVASEAANRAESLSNALEAARSDASALNAELRAEHRRKDEFLAMLGHELRNPLAPLVTSIALLRRQPAGGATPELVNIMARQTAQLSRLVDDLLDVSRVSQGKIELRRRPLLLSEVIEGALEESRAVMDTHRHHVVLHGGDPDLAVNGDRARLVQVFGNLLNNAAKYTDPGGEVTVSLSREGQNAVVRIQDTGIGIAAQMQARVFDLFSQVTVAVGRSQGGLGIGLTLVRTLVGLHGGKISVESEGLGKGSTFVVRLPLAAASPAVAQPAPALRVGCPPGNNSLRVLIVDDNRDAADSMAELLRLLGHHANVAYDGQSALRLYGGLPVDLALLDIGLPDLDGYELARRLRQTNVAGARFVALTGFGTDDTKRRLQEAGFDEHVVKPISNETLAHLLTDTQRRDRATRPSEGFPIMESKSA